MNTGPHSPARAALTAEMRKAAVRVKYSQGMERPDIPGPPICGSWNLLHVDPKRSGDGVGKVPNLFRAYGALRGWATGIALRTVENPRRSVRAAHQFQAAVLGDKTSMRTWVERSRPRFPLSKQQCQTKVAGGFRTRPYKNRALTTRERIDHDHAQPRPDRCRQRQIGIRFYLSEQHLDRRDVGLIGAGQFRSGHNPALLTGGSRLSIFRHQPITPVRRLAGCDAESRKHSALVCLSDERSAKASRWRRPLHGCVVPVMSARPASLSFSWAAAASRACEPFEVSRVTGLTNARYADGAGFWGDRSSAPTRVPQSFSQVPA